MGWGRQGAEGVGAERILSAGSSEGIDVTRRHLSRRQNLSEGGDGQAGWPSETNEEFRRRILGREGVAGPGGRGATESAA